MAGILFIFAGALLRHGAAQSRFFTDPPKRNLYVGAHWWGSGLWAYSGLAFNMPTRWGSGAMSPNLLNVFVAVVFVNAPTVFRIVRGITLDHQARAIMSPRQTRGEGPWYIMLWEILPNARGPLIVDFCLRIGYTTILLGTLGFFGLGVSPESPDWGSTINHGRRLLSVFPHPAAGARRFALMSAGSGPQPARRRPARRKPERLMFYLAKNTPRGCGGVKPPLLPLDKERDG
jgi:peptide/nickel transport system permease protein